MKARGPVVGVVRTPTIFQMEALECGAAALAMVLAHYGRWMPLEELRVLCGVSRDGSKAVNILKAARALGLKAQGKRQEPNDLAKLPVPAILYVGMNHFVVFEGVIKRGKGLGFQVNDPATGRRTISAEDFDSLFTGITLTFEPTEDFQTGGAPPSVLPRLGALLRPSGAAQGERI
jgi:ABC-type bacteriocin/lantibiotic exporter with double-glycine peptidase domain